MKTNLLALLFTLFAAVANAVEPNVDVTVEPVENGAVIYAPMGIPYDGASPTGRLWLKVRITNNDDEDLTLTGFRVILTGTDVTYARNVPCVAGGTTASELSHANGEIITVPHPAPPLVTIRLYFSGNPTPKQVQRFLIPYTPAVPGGQYLFPADEGDLGPEEYFSAGQAHTADSGQGWGADWNVYRIISKGNYSTIRAGGVSSVNSDRVGWGIPIRAMADGTVLRTSTGWISNPTPGTRAFQLMSEFDGEAITDVKVTRLSETQAASAQLLPSGQVQLSVWNTANTGRQITRLGSSPLVAGENVTAVAIDALTATRVVGVFRMNVTNNIRVVVWDITDEGNTVTRPWNPIETGGVTDVSVAKMTSSRFAIVGRTEAGQLWVMVWEVNGSGPTSLASEIGESVTAVSAAALTSTRVATSARTNAGLLKVAVWDLTGAPGSYEVEKRGEQTAESISRLAAVWNAGDKWVTATRMNAGGLLRLTRWYASANGEQIFSELGTTTTQVVQNTALAIAPGTGSAGMVHATTASVIAGGVFKINGWGNDPENSPTAYEYSAQNTAGTVTHVSIDELGDTEYFVGVRTAGGALKIMTWHWAGGGGNNVVMLHGDCRVLYAHFQDGSIDTSLLYPGATVKAGQVLGHMGNSGASSGPHTHIHSERIFPITSIPEMILREALGTLPLIGSRPIPFTGARAMQLSEISPGGEGNPSNDFATLDGQGMYDLSLGIRPRLSTRYIDLTSTLAGRTGLKDPQPGSPITGGPKRTVAEMLGVAPSFMRLYIRGGSYDEAVTLATPMVVRRYDFHSTGGPVVIGK